MFTKLFAHHEQGLFNNDDCKRIRAFTMLYNALHCLFRITCLFFLLRLEVSSVFFGLTKLLRDSLRPLPMYNGKTHQNRIQNKQRTGCRNYGGLLRDIAGRKTACAGISFNAESSPPPPQCVKSIPQFNAFEHILTGIC